MRNLESLQEAFDQTMFSQVQTALNTLTSTERETIEIPLSEIINKALYGVMDYKDTVEGAWFKSSEQSQETVFSFVKEAVPYAVEQFKQYFNNRDKFKILGEQSNKFRDAVAEGLTVPFKVVNSAELLGEHFVHNYVVLQLRQIPGELASEQREALIKHFLDDLVEKLGGPKELKPVLQNFYQLPRYQMSR